MVLSLLRVENIESVKVRVSADQAFSSHRDHSKWAVATDGSSPYVCVGDINRMESQKHRAGGTVCVYSKHVWQSFHSLVTSVESCPLTSSGGDDSK